MNSKSQPRCGSGWRSALGLTAGLALAACASARPPAGRPPPPPGSLQDARHAIATAEQAEAGRYASEDLSQAREKIASADAAVSDKKMITAQHLAEESTADAELATAKTADIKANAVNNDMTRS